VKNSAKRLTMPTIIRAESQTNGAVLRLAADYIRYGWCQGAHARDAQGRVCNRYESEAVAWSLVGAVQRAAIERRSEVGALYSALQEQAGEHNLHAWNDARNRTQAEVLEVLHKAATREEEREGRE
jgi:predicted Fe-S protein YdhL (DUF1289 family)